MSATKNESPAPRFVHGSNDALFGCIERIQGDKPFGALLDAGTGTHSLRWIATLPSRGMSHFTAVTADKTMQQNVIEEAQRLGVVERGNIVIGNWFGSTITTSSSLLELQVVGNETYDVILADYLIGALDGFSPYHQDLMIPKLLSHLKPKGGRLYIVGLEPIPDQAQGDANVICKVRQVRDACILLAGHRCYREYPLEWILRQVMHIPNVRVVETCRFPILYRHATILKQINVARSKFPYFATKGLALEMTKVLDDLEQEALQATQRSPTNAISFGFDYVVAIEKL